LWQVSPAHKILRTKTCQHHRNQGGFCFFNITLAMDGGDDWDLNVTKPKKGEKGFGGGETGYLPNSIFLLYFTK